MQKKKKLKTESLAKLGKLKEEEEKSKKETKSEKHDSLWTTCFHAPCSNDDAMRPTRNNVWANFDEKLHANDSAISNKNRYFHLNHPDTTIFNAVVVVNVWGKKVL